MAYVDYTYYTGTYMGTKLTSTEFPNLAIRASAQIDLMTFNRAEPIITAGTDATTIQLIKFATCAVAEELHLQDEVDVNGRIQSERVGQHSVTYIDSTPKGNTNQERLFKAAKTFLGTSGLMFKGFYTGEYGGVSDED